MTPAGNRTHDRPPDSVPLGISVDEAASLLGVSRAHAYRLVQDGTLPSVRLRRRIVVPLRLLASLLDLDTTSGD